MALLNLNELIFSICIFSTPLVNYLIWRFKLENYQFIFSYLIMSIIYKYNILIVILYQLLFIKLIYLMKNNKYRQYIISFISLPFLFIIQTVVKYIKLEETVDLTNTLMINTIQLYWLALDIKDTDTFFNILNYLNCTASFITGPPIPYIIYRKRFSDMNRSIYKGYEKYTKNKYTYKPFLFFESIISLVLHILIKTYCLYGKKSFFYNIFYMIIIGFGFRCKFYFVWKLAEFNFYLLGYENICNIHPVSIESAITIKDITNNWNIFTNMWLKDFIFNIFRSQSILLASFITFFISAFYHGPNFCYAMLFLSVAFMIRYIKNNNRIIEVFIKNKQMAKTLQRLHLILIVSYYMVPFILLSVVKSLEYWKSVFYYGHVLILLSVILNVF